MPYKFLFHFINLSVELLHKYLTSSISPNSFQNQIKVAIVLSHNNMFGIFAFNITAL